MKITIETTSKIVQLKTADGTVPARIWEGKTERGTPVHCFVTRICPSIPEPVPEEIVSEFAKDLAEQAAPSAAVQGIPFRFFID